MLRSIANVVGRHHRTKKRHRKGIFIVIWIVVLCISPLNYKHILANIETLEQWRQPLILIQASHRKFWWFVKLSKWPSTDFLNRDLPSLYSTWSFKRHPAWQYTSYNSIVLEHPFCVTNTYKILRTQVWWVLEENWDLNSTLINNPSTRVFPKCHCWEDIKYSVSQKHWICSLVHI